MTEAESGLRLFTAIELPDEWRAALARVGVELERAGGALFKWARPELLHVTLVFLGYHERTALPGIERSLEAASAGVTGFGLRLGRLGSFGPQHAMSVIWAGLDGIPDELALLHREISERLAAAGVAFDRKPLVPHVTLARGRRPVDRDASLRVAAAMQRTVLPRLTARVTEFVLMQSRLSRQGPAYEVLRRFHLREKDVR